MAGNTVNIKLQLTSEGMDSAQKQAEAINSNLQSAGAAAKALGSTLGSMGRAGTPTPGEAPTAGSPSSRRAARAPSSAAAPPPSPTVAAVTRATQPMGGSDIEDYNRARGASGAAGGSARDFADQARGLGGLVRLYATFAANIFAVSAAFNALSRAMDTTNMVKGLDQLGAASGRNLGSLSKQLMNASDGAISLREAMEATAKASSAGLSNKQILELGDAAKKASQALGLNMSDAFSRLSRGISKIEPELLDELGIFVKIEDATQNYARSVGKTVTSLSDFERRQAFANAVLDQAKQKFGSIEIDVNPYTKLLATLQNVLQTGLEFINKFLAPVAKYLSESPTALTAVLIGVGAVLLKQVMPVLGEMGAGFRKASEEAARSAENIKKNFSEEWVNRLESRFKVPELSRSLKEVDRQISSLTSKPIPQLVAAPQKLASMASVQKLGDDEKSLRTVQDLLKKRQDYVNTGMQGAAKLSAKELEGFRAEVDWLKKKEDQIARNIQKRELEAKKTQIQIQLDEANAKVAKRADKPLGAIDPEKLATTQYERSIRKRDQLSAIATAAEDARILGIRESWGKLNKEVEDKGIKGMSKYTTLAVGGAAIVTNRIMAIAGAFSYVGMAAAALFGVYELFDSFASKATKQQEEFNNKIEATQTAVKGAKDTLDLYITKKKDAFSLNAITAFTTALAEVSSSFDEALFAARKFYEAANAWDRLKDSVGKSNLDKVQKAAFEDIKSIGQLLFNTADGTEKFYAELAKIGITQDQLESVDKFNKSFQGLTDEQRLAKLKGIQGIFKVIKQEQEFTTNATKAFTESLKEVDKIVDQIIQANAFQDLQGKLGVELVSASEKFAQALQDPLKALEAIAALAKDPKALAVIPKADIQNLAQAVQLQQELATIQKEIEDRKSKKKTVESEVNFAGIIENIGLAVSAARGPAGISPGAAVQVGEAQQERRRRISEADAAIKQSEAKLNRTKEQAKAFVLEQTTLVTKIADAGFDRIEAGLKRARDLANISISKEKLSLAAGIGADVSRQQYELSLKEIGIQRELITAAYNQEIAARQNTEALNKLSAIQMEQMGRALMERSGATEEDKRTGAAMMEQGSKTRKIITAKEDLRQGISPELVKLAYGEAAAKVAQSELRGDRIPQLKREAAQAALNAQATNAALKFEDEKIDQIARKRKERLALEKESINIQNELINIASQLNSYSSVEILNLKEKNQLDQINNEFQFKRADLGKQFDKLQKDKADITAEEFKRLSDNLDLEYRNLYAQKDAKTLAAEYNTIKEKTSATIAKLSAQEAVAAEKLKASNSVLEARITYRQKEIDLLAQLGYIDELTASRRKTELELQLQKIRFIEQEANLKANIAQKEAALAGARDIAQKAQIEVNKPGGDTEVNRGALASAKEGQAVAQAQLEASKASLDAAQKVNGIIVEGINLQQTYNEKLIAQKEHLQDIANISSGLATVFGPWGKALGDAITATDNLSTQQKQYNQQLSYNNAIINDKEASTEAVAQATAANAKITSKMQKDEIGGYAQIVGSVKGMFNQKSKAYKAFAAVEKVLHMARLAMEIKEQIVKLTTDKTETASKLSAEAAQTAGTQAGAAARSPTYIGEIWAKTLGQLGPIAGPVVAAGLAAFVLSMLGGSSKSPPGGFTAEEQQKVQGTGQFYDESGKLVTSKGAALGDPTQKSESIAKGIEGIEKYSFKGLEYSNKMLDALRAIQRNTENFTSNLLKAIPDINISMPAITSGNWLTGRDVTQVVDQGIQLQGTIGQLIDQQGKILKYVNTVTESGGALFGLFGGGTYAGSEVTQINSDPLTENISQIFKDVGTAIGTAAEGLGVASAESIMTGFRAMDISEQLRVSTKDLKPSEIADVVLNVISAGLDTATAGLLPQFKKFQRAGETFGDTVLRVANEVRVVDMSFKELGLSIENLQETGRRATQAELDRVTAAQRAVDAARAANEALYEVRSTDYMTDMVTVTQVQGTTETAAAYASALAELQRAQEAVTEANSGLTTKNIEVRTSLIELAGGLDKFVEQTSFFRDNFMTDSQRMRPVMESLSAEMARLAGRTISSREEFFNLVSSLDVTDESQRELRQSLINTQEALLEVIEYEEKLTDARLDQRQSILKLQESIAKATGDDVRAREIAATALAENRARELDGLDESLRAGRSYQFALEDELKIREELKSLQEKQNTAIKRAIDANKNFLKTILDYKTQLLGGALTTLSPMEQYQMKRDEAMKVFAAAQSTGTSEAEVRAREEALGKLPQVANTFLESSRTMFASGTNYAQDFNSVLEVLDATGVQLEAQVDKDQLALDAAQSSAQSLGNIELSSQQIADRIQELLNSLSSSTSATDTARVVYDASLEAARSSSFATLTQEAIDAATAPNASIPEPITQPTVTALSQTTAGATTADIQAISSTLDTTASSLSNDISTISNSLLDLTSSSIIDVQAVTNSFDSSITGLSNDLRDLQEPVIQTATQTTAPDIQSFTTQFTQLTQAITEVREELVAIKEGQDNQTATFVYTTYDSNTKNAEAISTALAESVSLDTFKSDVVETGLR